MNQTPQFNVEDAIGDLLAGIAGLNVYTTNRTGLRLFPFATISASVNSQMLGNYTGVYDMSVAVNYSDTAAKISQADFDAEYCSIFEAFYSETPTLATKIENTIFDTKIHMARISSQSPSIRANKRAWQRGLTISVICTPLQLDPDAEDYILRVEAADGQLLESQVRSAINTFVIDCKADGNWNSIVASCIMAGARTVAGAVTPLRGNAPTNNNFVAGDYSRTLGLLGDASTKFISTSYDNTDASFPQDNTHISCYVTQAPTTSATLGRMFIGQATGTGGRIYMFNSIIGSLSLKNRSNPGGGAAVAGQGTTTGFKGHSRSTSTNTIIRSSQTNTISTLTSTTLVSGSIAVFNNGASALYSDARMSFYSLGTNIDLALLDSRITTLMNTLASVIV